MLKQGKWIGIVAIACIGGLVSAAFVFSAQGPDNQNSGSQVSNSQIDYTQSNGVTKGNVQDTSEKETVELLRQLVDLTDPLQRVSNAPYQLSSYQSYYQRMPLGVIGLVHEAFPELGAIDLISF